MSYAIRRTIENCETYLIIGAEDRYGPLGYWCDPAEERMTTYRTSRDARRALEQQLEEFPEDNIGTIEVVYVPLVHPPQIGAGS